MIVYSILILGFGASIVKELTPSFTLPTPSRLSRPQLAPCEGWQPGRDSNPDTQLQRLQSYR